MKKNRFYIVLFYLITLNYLSNAQTFTNINAGLTGLHYSDVAWADYDADGDLDVIIAGSNSDEVPITILYKNEGSDTFTEISTPIPGTQIGDIVWGDYDNDGDLDILIQGYLDGSSQITRIYENEGNNIFNDIQIGLPALADGSVAFMDYNNDGFLDILIDGYTGSGNAAFVYKNNGDKTFTQTDIEFPGVFKAAYEWADYDNDGDLDVFIIGFGESSLLSKLYRNDGDETFSETTNTFTNVWLGDVAWGDYDNDGDLDIMISGYTLDVPFPNDRVAEIYKNNGDGSFTKLVNPGLKGVSHSTSVWGDFDNDGDLDAFIGGAYVDTSSQWIRVIDVFTNNADDTFTETGLSFSNDAYWGESAWGDYDADGDLDLIACGYDDDGSSHTNIYRNDAGATNTIPNPPNNLSANVTNRTVNLSWDASTDNETPSSGLSYNVYIYNQSTDETIWTSMSNTTTGLRLLPALGNAMQNTSWTINNLPNGNYVWSVQAIDHNFAGSLFATEGSFTIDEAQASISVTPTSIDFGDIQVGTEAIEAINIENTGTLDLEITLIAGTENFTLSYEETGTYTDSLSGTTITPISNTDVYIKFYSESTQVYNETLTIYSNAANNANLDIPVSANCIPVNINSIDKTQLFYNYPNPINNETTFFFNIPENQNAELQIINCLGKVIDYFNITEKKSLSYNTSKLKSGLYFYRITVEGKTLTKKMFKL